MQSLTLTPETRHATSASELVNRCLAGESRAWSEFIDRYSPLIFGVIKQHNLRRDEREDVFQSTWTKVLEKIHKLQRPERVAGWLVVIAKNESLKHIKKYRRDYPVPDFTDICTSEWIEDVSETAITRLLKKKLGEAIAVLPESDRKLLNLLLSDPAPSYDQISEELEMPRGSIGPTRARCLNRLKRTI